MKALAEHILDITQNSVSAGAQNITISLTEDEHHTLTIVISDDGCGMTPEFLASVTDPFTTTRTTRKVGLGLPLYRMTAEMTGGELRIQSAVGEGTTVTAVVHTDHLDCPPIGDLPNVIALLIQGSPDIDFAFTHTTPAGTAELFTKEIRAILGDEISLSEPEIFSWIQSNLSEQEAQIEGAV